MFPAAAAGVGGVGGPVPRGCFLPLDGDVDVGIEHPGEGSGGQFGGESEQDGGAVLLGLAPCLCGRWLILLSLSGRPARAPTFLIRTADGTIACTRS